MNTLSGMLVRSARTYVYGAVDRMAIRPLRCAGRALRDTRAVTSIEFAAIALPFFTLVMGTMAIGLWFFCAAAIDIAVYGSGRQIQTGALESGTTLSAMNSGQFNQQVLCPNITLAVPVIPCNASNPVVRMAVVPDFTKLLNSRNIAPLNQPPVYVYSLKTLSSSSFCTPGAGTVVYIQAVYTVPIFGAVITYFGGDPLISGTTVEVEQTPGAPSNACPPYTGT